MSKEVFDFSDVFSHISNFVINKKTSKNSLKNLLLYEFCFIFPPSDSFTLLLNPRCKNVFVINRAPYTWTFERTSRNPVRYESGYTVY